MRAKLLRADNDGGTVLLVYPQTRKEYGRALRAVERLHGVAGRGGHDAGREGFGPADGGGVVTTVAQRQRWGLPDLTTCGQARVVDEAQVLGLRVDRSAGAEAVDEALPDGGIEAGPVEGGDPAEPWRCSAPPEHPLHPFDARNCSAGLMATPVLITPGNVRGSAGGCPSPHRGRRRRRVGERTTARQVRVARRAGPRPGDGAKRRAPSAKAPSW